MNSHAQNIRLALLKASPEVRAQVDTSLRALEADFKRTLEQRLREADTARQGWVCEQETAIDLRVEVNQLKAELEALRQAMVAASQMLCLGASPAINLHDQAA